MVSAGCSFVFLGGPVGFLGKFKEPASLAPIKTTHLRPDSCIPIFMYKNNLLGWDLVTWV